VLFIAKRLDCFVAALLAMTTIIGSDYRESSVESIDPIGVALA